MAVIEAIATTYLEANTSSVSFTSLGSYEHLQVRASLHGTHTSAAHLWLRPNGDTTGINWFDWVEGVGSTAWSDGRFNLYPYQNLYEIPTVTSHNEAYATYVIDIFDYRNTGKTTTMTYLQGYNGIIGSNTSRVLFGQGLYRTTSALTSLEFLPSTGSFKRGSSFTVYGLNNS